MIDTVVLLLSKDQFTITNPDAFTPSAQWVLKGYAARGVQSKQNPTTKELKAGIYKPRLTLRNGIDVHGVWSLTLKIELSLPKLLFGNNFQELRQKDFDAVITELVDVLHSMGVATTFDTLATAHVSAIHYGKNIQLTDGSTPYHFISKIKEAHITWRRDTNQTNYPAVAGLWRTSVNEGHCYKWHCNSYEVLFYDKIKDLEKAKVSGKRAIEKDSAMQLDLFGALRKKKKFEVLRMEVRLNKRIKLKQLFKELKIKSDLTLKSLFKPATAKKVLLHYLQELETQRPALLDMRFANDKALLSTLVINNPELSARQLLTLFGLKKVLEGMTVRELQIMLAKQNQRSFARLMNEVKRVNVPKGSNVFEVLRNKITN